MTGYVMAPTPAQIADHIDKWNALLGAGVEGLPEYPMDLQSPGDGQWGGVAWEADYWRSRENQTTPRHAYRLPPLPSLPPEPETVVVVDANTAHELIGRSVGGRKVSQVLVGGTGFSLRDLDGYYFANPRFGSSVSLDPLPAPPPDPVIAAIRVEPTFNKRTPDRWTFDVEDELGVVCSVPAAGRDDVDAQRIAARIARLLADGAGT